MNPMTDLGLRFVRRPGPGGRAANLAALGATAIVALLVSFLIAGSLGLTHRSDRIGWRNTDDGEPKTAVGAVNEVHDMVAGEPVNRVDLAINNPKRDGELPPPPGLSHAPKPGEVFVSPELAKRWSEDLRTRYKLEQPTGIISDAGLSSPDELIVIRGVAKDSPGVAQSDHPRYLDTWRGNAMDSRMAMLLALVAFGIALVLFPLLSLVGQAAGVAAKRREHRLAALRLAGATRRQVLWLSAVEQAVLGFLGAIAGLIGYVVLSPLIARIPLGGGRWYLHDLTPSWWVTLIVLVAVPVLSVISALIGLGRVSITPLGVVRGQTRKSTSALRLVLLVIGPIMLAVLGTGGAVLPLVIGIGIAALAVRVVGPWAVQVIGKFLARTAKGPVVLLAGRRLADDPKGAFRPVAALVLSGFVTGFLALFMPYGLTQDGKDVSFQLYTNQGQTAVVAEDARKRLSEAGFKGEVTTGDQSVSISVSTTERERLRTVLYDVVPSQVPLTDAERDKQDAGVFMDMRLGVALLLGLVFVTGAASTAAGAVGTALDQAAPAKALRRSGVPLQVIERSARLAAVVPVVAVGLPVVGFGALCGLALSGGQVVTRGSSGVILLLGQVVVGVVLVAVAGAAGAPVLRKASAG
ncbi:FtsX-like permease family protein [Kribbella sp. VKM Ac-2568]|uniref:FtsX-like permease family protein n=1 Tax=Kribbella sp. VKM Ac-2568 TaxID=2512219 RepID=UPI001044FB69|nr:FtsX-like permease family protein [Kribbella sp. VKM Ac-2568]TCM40203.1 FtsX-like permease family protein [Kribbella sp. VKM Ac-2568]